MREIFFPCYSITILPKTLSLFFHFRRRNFAARQHAKHDLRMNFQGRENRKKDVTSRVANWILCVFVSSSLSFSFSESHHNGKKRKNSATVMGETWKTVLGEIWDCRTYSLTHARTLDCCCWFCYCLKLFSLSFLTGVWKQSEREKEEISDIQWQLGGEMNGWFN